MQTKELHRISFMVGYDFHRSATPNRVSVLSYHITGNPEWIAFDDTTSLDHVLDGIRATGMKTMNRVMEAGQRWARLSRFGKLLLLDNQSYMVLSEEMTENDVYDAIYRDLLSSRTRYALNYFFEAPLSIVLNRMIIKLSRYLYDHSDKGKEFDTTKINRRKVGELLIQLTQIVRTFLDVGPIEEVETISDNIAIRIGLASKVRAALYLSPLIIFIPILLIGAQAGGNFNTDGVGGTIALFVSFSGLLPAAAVGIKFMYDFLVPRGEINSLETQISNLGLPKLFGELFEYRLQRKQRESPDRYNPGLITPSRILRIFDWIEFRLSYPLTMYFFSANKVGTWEQYAGMFRGETGRVPV